MKICSPSSVIRKMQTKATMRYCLRPAKMANYDNRPECGELGHSDSAGGDVQWDSHFRKQTAAS